MNSSVRVIWSANTGWINLGHGTPANGIYYQNHNAADFGVNRDDSGNLTGYGWGATIGWITFTNRTDAGAWFDGPKVNLLTGRFSGFAWGVNVGWISLSNLLASVQTVALVPGADSDGDGIPDAWELSHFGNLTVVSLRQKSALVLVRLP